jgi:ribosome maturation factor RimP
MSVNKKEFKLGEACQVVFYGEVVKIEEEWVTFDVDGKEIKVPRDAIDDGDYYA